MLAQKSTSAIVVLIVALFVTSSKSKQFHELLTDEEFSKIFRTTRDKVPAYELAHITHNIKKRSTSGARINFEAFGREVEAFLNPADSILAGENTPVWRSYIDSDGNLRFSKMDKWIVGLVACAYENAVNVTMLFVRENEETNTLSLYGNMEHDGLRIVPWPGRVREETREEFNRLKREAPKTSPDMTVSDYHVIIKTESVSKLFDSLKRNVREISRLRDGDYNPRWIPSEPKIIKPSLMISTDYANPKTAEDDFAYYDDIIYQLSFWNAVDLRFRALQNPQVQIRIAGLIFGQSRSASPWIDNNVKDGKVDLYAAFDSMQKIWYSWKSDPDFSDDAYNVAVSITDLPLFIFGKDGKAQEAAGYGAMGGICNVLVSQSRILSNIIISDHHGYDGVHSAVHELGHMLGASHDKSNGGDCDASFGYIMSPTTKATENSLQWSTCSKKEISDFLRSRFAMCAQKPAELHPPGDPVLRILPGRVLDADQQCQARGYYWACKNISPANCRNLRCRYSGFHRYFLGCYNGHAAVDGTTCGENMACVNGECKSYETEQSGVETRK